MGHTVAVAGKHMHVSGLDYDAASTVTVQIDRCLCGKKTLCYSRFGGCSSGELSSNQHKYAYMHGTLQCKTADISPA